MNSTDRLAQEITIKNSLQTYCIIRFLSDNNKTNSAFKAYAYFRWLDDQIDKNLSTRKECVEFLDRQKQLIIKSYNKKTVSAALPEEKLILELIASEATPNSLLKSYIYNFFSVMEFDAKRKGKVITQKDLDWYSQTIGKAVTDCITYFLGGKYENVNSSQKYKAATAAHIVHMLRDFKDDMQNGFINIPVKNPTNKQINAWVKERVNIAKKYFKEGKEYISSVPNIKRKIAAYLFCIRFEPLLWKIEKNNYLL